MVRQRNDKARDCSSEHGDDPPSPHGVTNRLLRSKRARQSSNEEEEEECKDNGRNSSGDASSPDVKRLRSSSRGNNSLRTSRNDASSDPSPPASQRNSVSTRRSRRQQQRQNNHSTNVAAPSQKNRNNEATLSLRRSKRRRSSDDAENQPPPKKQRAAKKTCACKAGAIGGCPDCLRDIDSHEGKDKPNEADQNPIEAPSSVEDDDLSTTPAFEESLARAADEHQMKRLFIEKHGNDIIRFVQNLKRLGHPIEKRDGLANKFHRKMFELFKKSLREDFESTRRRKCCNNGVEEVEDVGDVEDGDGNETQNDDSAAASDDPFHLDVEFSEQSPSESPTSAYTSEYCEWFKLDKDKVWEINFCHENNMDLEDNDTLSNWNRLNNIARARKGEEPKTYIDKSFVPLRKRFLRCSFHKATAFRKCTPHPRFDLNAVGTIKLQGDLTVQQAVEHIRHVRDATFKATGENKAVFPVFYGYGVKKGRATNEFYAKGGIYATIGHEVTNLKARARLKKSSYVAKVILTYMHVKGGLCLDNAKAWTKYRSGRGSNDGRMHYYTAPLFHVANLKLLPHMTQYDVIGLARQIVARIRAHSTYIALAPLRELQRNVYAFLQNNIRLIEEWRLRPENSPPDNLLFMYMRMLWQGPGSTCRICDERGVPDDDARRSVSTFHNAHVGKEGRALKRDLVGGRHPSDCNFTQLLAQYHVLENMCPEHHLGVVDQSTLSTLASGDLDHMLGSASFRMVDVVGSSEHLSHRTIFRARVMNLVLHELSGGVCQLSDLPWKLSEATGVDFHHLTMKKNFVDANGKVWKTMKSKRKGRKELIVLPENKWVDAMVEDFATGIVASKSRHNLLHFVYGPKKMNGLLDHLEYSLPWDESDKYIMMPGANAD